jgi:anti-sigma factor RsiW
VTCEQANELIGPYVDADLPSEVQHRLENHLLYCRDCAYEAQSLTITRARLRNGIGEVVASDAFRSRVLSILREDNPHLPSAPETESLEPTQYRLPIALP